MAKQVVTITITQKYVCLLVMVIAVFQSVQLITFLTATGFISKKEIIIINLNVSVILVSYMYLNSSLLTTCAFSCSIMFKID